MDSEPSLLTAHLRSWLGAWPPPSQGISVVGSGQRTTPSWDGSVRDLLGVFTPEGGILSVASHHVDAFTTLLEGDNLADDYAALVQNESLVGELLGRQGRFGQAYFRWSDSPTPGTDVGEWVPTNDPRVPEWLTPFNGDVLIAWDDAGTYAAGVGRKQHDRFGHEISVGTEEALRGRGIARQLVATAARRILDDGAVPTYLHAMDNFASGRVADASGFPDRGWRVVGFWGA